MRKYYESCNFVRGGQRDKCSGQTVLSGQKSVFYLVEPAPMGCVTDFTTLVIFVQLICVTCPAAEGVFVHLGKSEGQPLVTHTCLVPADKVPSLKTHAQHLSYSKTKSG